MGLLSASLVGLWTRDRLLLRSREKVDERCEVEDLDLVVRGMLKRSSLIVFVFIFDDGDGDGGEGAVYVWGWVWGWGMGCLQFNVWRRLLARFNVDGGENEQVVFQGVRKVADEDDGGKIAGAVAADGDNNDGEDEDEEGRVFRVANGGGVVIVKKEEEEAEGYAAV